jgi:hypothetical protein
VTTYRDLERIASYGLPGGEILLAVIEADLIAKGRIAAPAGLIETRAGDVVTLANAITVAGYAATLGWLRTGNVPLAILGLLADEFDGSVERTRERARLGRGRVVDRPHPHAHGPRAARARGASHAGRASRCGVAPPDRVAARGAHARRGREGCGVGAGSLAEVVKRAGTFAYCG